MWLDYKSIYGVCGDALWGTSPWLRSLFSGSGSCQVYGDDREVRHAFGGQSYHDPVSRLCIKQPFKCRFRPFKGPDWFFCARKGENARIEGSNCKTRAGGPRSCKWSGIWILASSNLWARLWTSRPPTISDGYFYTLTMVPADVSHKNFKTTTWLLKAVVHMVWLGVEGRNICLPLKDGYKLIQLQPFFLFTLISLSWQFLGPTQATVVRKLCRSGRGLAVFLKKGCDVPVGWNEWRRLRLLPQCLFLRLLAAKPRFAGWAHRDVICVSVSLVNCFSILLLQKPLPLTKVHKNPPLVMKLERKAGWCHL